MLFTQTLNQRTNLYNLVWIKTNLYDWESTVRIINTYSDS